MSYPTPPGPLEARYDPNAPPDSLQDKYGLDPDRFLFNPGGPGLTGSGHANRDIASYGYENFDPNQAMGGMDPINRELSIRQQLQTGGRNAVADPGAYAMHNDPLYAQHQADAMNAAALAAQQRTAPTINMDATQPHLDAAGRAAAMAGGASQSLGAVGATGGLGGPTQATAASGLLGSATGAGYHGQIGAANGLAALGVMPAGPSVAELAMRQQSDANIAAASSLAAGARGGNAALAMQNAAQQQGQIGGQLTQQVGVQRAAEDLQNRQFSAGALSAAGQAYGAAAGTQMAGYGGAGQVGAAQTGQQINALTGEAQAAGQAGSTALGAAGVTSGVATQNAANNLIGQRQNDVLTLGQEGQANQYDAQQLAANQAYDAARTGGWLSERGQNLGLEGSNPNRGSVTGSAGGDKGLGAGLAAAGAAAIALSDIRAKKDVVPAGADVSQAFRGLTAASRRTEGGIRGSSADFPDAPAYGYDYRDPNSPGAEPGQHFGPMAQDLETTPAGASVVGEKGGKKYVDTGRLSMLTASEVSKQRRELDALMSMGRQISAPQSPYPQPYLY